MNIHQTMAIQAGGPGSGRTPGHGGLPEPEHISHLKRLGIGTKSDLKKHMSSFLQRYSTGGGKLMSHLEALTKILGSPEAASYALRELPE